MALMIIAIVVTAIVTVATYGTTSELLYAELGVTAETASAGVALGVGVAAGATAGAAGAAAGQGVMMAGGQQSGFNWENVGLGALSGAVTGGLGASGLSDAASASLGRAGGQIAMGAARSVATQGMAMAIGAQRSFDWNGMAASAIASGVASAVGQTSLGQTPYVGTAAAGLAAGVTSTLVHGDSLQRNAGAIVGDTIGAMVTVQMAQRDLDTVKLKTEQAINGANVPFTPADARSFDATASSLGLTSAEACALMASDNGRSMVGDAYSPYTPGVEAFAVPYPQIAVRELAPIVMDTVSPLSEWDSLRAFNPVAKFAEGVYDRAAAMASGVGNVLAHPLDTAAAIGAHYTNAYDAGRLGDTILNDVGSAITGGVKSLPPLAAVNGLYKKDTAGAAHAFGGSAADAALFVVPELAGPAVALGGAALERGAVMFGSQIERTFERAVPGLRFNVVPEGQSFSSTGVNAFSPAPSTGVAYTSESLGTNILELTSRQKFDAAGNIVPAMGIRSEMVSTFNPGQGDLFVNFYRTTENGRGVGTEMLSNSIQSFGPQNVHSVSAELGLTNKSIFEYNMSSEGMSPVQAVSNTPLGKSLISLGYRHIEVNGLYIKARLGN